jgi:transcriptional regulator of arginine metabolism
VQKLTMMKRLTLPHSSQRLTALKKLLSQGRVSTQDELREGLQKQEFDVTQSTVSRDLRRIGAVKVIDQSGRTVYRLPEDAAGRAEPASLPLATDFKEMVVDIRSNGALIVISTSPDCASLVARRLDYAKPERILGTIAGYDTIFVAPSNINSIPETIEAIRQSLAAPLKNR